MAHPALAAAPQRSIARPNWLQRVIIRYFANTALPTSELPVARVKIDRECTTIRKNPAHWRVFGGELPDLTTGLRCHCEEIRALDILDPEHCTLKHLSDQAKSKNAPVWGIEFARLQTYDDHHTYEIYLAKVSVEHRSPLIAIVELQSISDLHLRVWNPMRTNGTRVVAFELVHAGNAVATHAKEVTTESTPRYFHFDQHLHNAQTLLDAPGGGMRAALQYLREWLETEKDSMLWPEYILAAKLSTEPESAQELRTLLQRQRDRLFDGPAIAQCYQELSDFVKKALKSATISSDYTSAPLVAHFENGMATADSTNVDRLANIRDHIVRDSDDVALRREYARVLRSTGDNAQADFIDAQLTPPSTTRDWQETRAILQRRKTERAYGKQWSGFANIELPSEVRFEFRHGFVELLVCSTNFLDDTRLEDIAQRAPIRHLTIKRGNSAFRTVPSYLTDLRSLALDSCNLTDEDVRSLVTTPSLHRVAWLSLAYNPISMDGVNALAAATRDYLHCLRYVNLLGCQSDPREQVFFDHEAITGTHLPQEARTLEDRYGTLRWLHLIENGDLKETNRYLVAEAASLSRAPQAQTQGESYVRLSAYTLGSCPE